MKDKILIDLHYLGSIQYYKKLLEYKEVVFEANENFVRASYRNRCEICGPNGKSILTAQVKGGRKKQLYKNTELTYDHYWNTIHWSTLESNYRSSPYFEFYEDHLEAFFKNKADNLFDLNIKLFDIINKLLSLNIKYSFTDTFEKQVPENVDDFRSYFMPNKTNDDFVVAEYIQVFSSKNGFFPNLSILDLLFCEGPNAINYLK
ncbi:MAG: WbqC family protein [Chitinophagales bacterium]